MEKEKNSNKLLEYIVNNKKKITNGVMIFIVLSAFIFLSATLIKNTSSINRLEIQKQEVAAQLEAENQSNDELMAILENEDKDAYIEQKAREKGYAKSDEVVFYDISASE
ncbi:MAG: septum formation initiator family protein [Acetobacter sp.]|nr:septum formation initiator family protein [Bacteroides sp.]MCM1340675.1 septum formation initiator family protein [Acetobacter sp.]MCM1433786.1 septum formation initiator family protein [Clostridiales bacterium]